MNSKDTLISAFDRYCELTGLAPATVSTKVANDGKFYDSVKAGSGFTMKRYEKIMRWFQENTPKQPKKRKTN